MKEILPNIFAVEVPDDAKDVTIKNGAYVKWIIVDGNPFIPLNDPAKFKTLFATQDCTEAQAATIVEQQKGGGRYKDYLVAGSLAKSGAYLIYGAKNSLHSLLVSHTLNLSKNYLLLKKIS